MARCESGRTIASPNPAACGFALRFAKPQTVGLLTVPARLFAFGNLVFEQFAHLLLGKEVDDPRRESREEDQHFPAERERHFGFTDFQGPERRLRNLFARHAPHVVHRHPRLVLEHILREVRLCEPRVDDDDINAVFYFDET